MLLTSGARVTDHTLVGQVGEDAAELGAVVAVVDDVGEVVDGAVPEFVPVATKVALIPPAVEPAVTGINFAVACVAASPFVLL
jgi:hypothetical protein